MFDEPIEEGGGTDPSKWAVLFGAAWLEPFEIRLQDGQVHLRYAFILPAGLTRVRYTGPPGVFIDDVGGTVIPFNLPIPRP